MIGIGDLLTITALTEYNSKYSQCKLFVAMEKIWYLLIKGNREGPYSVKELKKDLRISPDTLVWREGFERWVPIGQVPELKAVFEENAPDEEDFEVALPEDEQIALQMKEEPPALLPIFIIIAILLFCYMLIKYFL